MQNPDPELLQCRKGREFIHYAERRGARVQNGGRHARVFNERGESVSVPVHGNGQEIGRGLRCVIVKAFIRLGLVGTILVAFLQLWNIL